MLAAAQRRHRRRDAGARWGMERRTGPTCASRSCMRTGSTAAPSAALQLARCKERRLTVVDKLSYSAAAPDLGTAVQRFRGADVTAVLHTGYQSDTVAFYRQMKQAGWLPRMVIGAGGGYALVDTRHDDRRRFRRHAQCRLPALWHQPGRGARPERHRGRLRAEIRRQAAERAQPGQLRRGQAVLRRLARGPAAWTRTRCAMRSRPPISPLGPTANSWGARFDDKGQNTLALPVVAQWHGNVLRTVQPSGAAVTELRPQLGASPRALRRAGRNRRPPLPILLRRQIGRLTRPVLGAGARRTPS